MSNDAASSWSREMQGILPLGCAWVVLGGMLSECKAEEERLRLLLCLTCTTSAEGRELLNGALGIPSTGGSAAMSRDEDTSEWNGKKGIPFKMIRLTTMTACFLSLDGMTYSGRLRLWRRYQELDSRLEMILFLLLSFFRCCWCFFLFFSPVGTAWKQIKMENESSLSDFSLKPRGERPF